MDRDLIDQQNNEILAWASKTPGEVMQELSTREAGLSLEEAQTRLHQSGPNEVSAQQTHWWQILGRQLKNPFIYILIAAALIAVLLGEKIDAIFILIFVLINTFLGFFQEFRSEQALRLLQSHILSHCRVRRAGKIINVVTTKIVPGDVIILEAGDLVPADLRLLTTEDFTVNESTLTGESVAVTKTSPPIKEAITDIYQATNLAFSGSMVVNGWAEGIVVATGQKTQFGRIAQLTVETDKESDFIKNLAKFSKFILRLIILTIVFVFLANIIIKGDQINLGELIVFSIALAVSVIPEALPVVTTLALSRGALHLVREKVVVKRLSAVEDLGGIEVLCTDKTGTLTENILTVAKLHPDSAPETIFYAGLCASSLLEHKIEPFDLAIFKQLNSEEEKRMSSYERIRELPFAPERRRNSVIVRQGQTMILIVRGAPEEILTLCRGLSPMKMKGIVKWLAARGQAGERVLAVAKKNIKQPPDHNLTQLEHDLTLVGLISFVDPIKESTLAAVEQAKRLGVQLKIITGDGKEVAGAVAKNIALIKSANAVISGQELQGLTPVQQKQAIKKYAVFARILPEQKYNIIQQLEETKVVGFLGEGINDAPALKAASVSLVVQGAADISREAADIILLQKDLKVIIDGIKEGRRVFANSVKYIKTTMASNFGNFYAVAIASLFINFLPMLPLQILLLNLLSDFPMISIASDNVDTNEVAKPQRYNLKDLIILTTGLGIVSTVFDFLFFGLFYRISPGVLQTNWFIGSVLTELVLLFVIRSHFIIYKASRPSKLVMSLSGLIFLVTIILPFTVIGQHFFRFVRPDIHHLILIVALVVVYFVCSEVVKLLYYRLAKP